MAAHYAEWLSLLVRWAHIITGIAWIGASFYFNWLENRLQRRDQPSGIAGSLWAVHGGGFYHVRKLSLAPEQLPDELHWFKWEAYLTWITGFALLCIVYYWNAAAFLVDARVAELSPRTGILVGMASLLLSWLIYDGLCRVLAGRRPGLLGLAILGWFTALAWGLGELLSARAAYLHVGAAIGTVMVANVFRVIIPSQKDLVLAVQEQRPPDATRAASALMRSRHNNYLTLPVLFIMISAHYPGTYAHERAWLVLLVLSLGGVLIRHYFNLRHLGGRAIGWGLAGVALLAGLVLATAPFGEKPAVTTAHPTSTDAVAMAIPTTAKVMAIVERRCTGCHAVDPQQEGFVSPPLGIVLEAEADLERHRQRVHASVAAGTMPLANLTSMTDDERRMIEAWYNQFD